MIFKRYRIVGVKRSFLEGITNGTFPPFKPIVLPCPSGSIFGRKRQKLTPLNKNIDRIFDKFKTPACITLLALDLSLWLMDYKIHYKKYNFCILSLIFRLKHNLCSTQASNTVLCLSGHTLTFYLSTTIYLYKHFPAGKYTSNSPCPIHKKTGCIITLQ